MIIVMLGLLCVALIFWLCFIVRSILDVDTSSKPIAVFTFVHKGSVLKVLVYEDSGKYKSIVIKQ